MSYIFVHWFKSDVQLQPLFCILPKADRKLHKVTEQRIARKKHITTSLFSMEESINHGYICLVTNNFLMSSRMNLTGFLDSQFAALHIKMNNLKSLSYVFSKRIDLLLFFSFVSIHFNNIHYR